MLMLALGGLLVLAGSLMLLVAAFRVSILWGLGCILLPFVQLIFVIVHWSESWRAVLLQTIGIVLMIAAALFSGDTRIEIYRQQFTQMANQQASGTLPDFSAMLASVRGAAQSGAAVNISDTEANSEQPAPAMPVKGQKTVYKCKDANGRISYSDMPCQGAAEKVITVKDEAASPTSSTLQSLKKAAESLDLPVSSKMGKYQCDGRTRCAQMKSCEEAKYFMLHCPGMEVEGDIDGIPCKRSLCKN